MNKKNFILIKSLVLLVSVFLTACEDEKPELTAQDHHDLAKLYFKQGAFKASIIEGKNAIQLKPNDVSILSTMAKILLKLSAADNARDLINKALKIDNTNTDLQLLLVKSYLAQSKLFSAQNAIDSIDTSTLTNLTEYKSLQAELLLANKKPKEAKKRYLSLLKNNKNNLDVILGTAKSALSLKQLDEVKKYTDLAITVAPTDIRALLWQAQVLNLQNQHREAETVLSRAMIELERYDTLTADKYAAIDMLAKTLVAQGKIQESFTYSNYLAQSRPGQVQASYEDAMTLISKNVDINEAEKAFQDVLNQAPRHKPSGIILGLINYQKGNYSEADEYLTKFSNDENSPLKSKKILASTKIKLNKITEAIQITTELLKSYPDDVDLHALQGLAYLIKKDADKSIFSLKRAIKLLPQNSGYHSLLSRSHLLKKEYKKAITAAKKALSIKPSSVKAKLSLISAYTASNAINKAKVITNKWLSETPKNVTALNVMASLEQKSSQHNKAKRLFQKVLNLNPGNRIANLNLAVYELSENKKSEALQKITNVINTQPDSKQALSLLLKISTDRKLTDKSLTTLLSVIAKNPKHISPRLALTQLYLNINKPKMAIAAIDDVTKIDNKNIQAYLFKARAHIALNNYEEAKQTYRILNSLTPDSTLGNIGLGQLSLLEKDFDNAIKHADKAISIQTDNISAHIILATAYLNQNIKNKMLEATNFIKTNIPNSHIPYEIEANYYFNDGRFSTAISSLKQAWKRRQNIDLANKIMLAYKKNNQNSKAFKAWDELAIKHKDNIKVQISYSLTLYQDKQYLKAISVLEQQLKKHPDNIIILNNLANVYHDSNNSKALKTAKKALANSPNNPAILDTLGWIYVNQLKDYDKGLPLLRRAYKGTPDPQIKEHLTKALIASGNTDELNNLK